MKRSFYLILFLCCLLFCTGCNQEIAQQQKPSESVTPPETVAPPPEPTLEERAAELVSKMTLEQKVGQLFFIRCPETEVEATIAQYQPGGILLFSRDFEPYTKEEVRSNLASYQQAAALPLLIGVDEEGGTVNRISRYPAFRSQPFPLSLIHIWTSLP